MKKQLSILIIVLISVIPVFCQPIYELINNNKISEETEIGDVINLIKATANSSVNYGSEAVFNNDHTWGVDVAVLDANHFVVVYGDWGDNHYGKAVVGTISGNSITYGNSFVFNPGPTLKPRVASLNSIHFVISFGDSIAFLTHNETLIAGAVSGNNISYGTPVVFNTPYGFFDSPVTSLGTNRFCVAYNDSNDSNNGKAIVGTLSGLSISLGQPCLYNIYSPPPPGYAYERRSITSLDSSTIAIAYPLTDDSLRAATTIGSVSGNTITFGSEYIFNTGEVDKLSITSLSHDRFVIAYVDRNINHYLYGTALVGNVNGNSISYGQEFDFYGQTSYVSASSLDSNHFVVLYWNNENVHSGASKIGTVVENTIYYDNENMYNPAYSFWQTVDCFNENRYVVAYCDEVNNYTPPHYGTSIIGVISQFPVITKIKSDTFCPGNITIPIITEYLEDVVEFSLTLDYDTAFQTYIGYQNSNSLLDTGYLNVTENNGQIDINWNSSSSIYITSDTLLELLFDNSATYSLTESILVWDSNSYYKDSQGTILETVFHDGHIIKEPIPFDADTIIGDSLVCQGSNGVSYQTNQIPNSTFYNWEIIPDSAGTIMGTDTIIEINFSTTYSGIVTLSVYGSNSCGDGASFSLIIDITESPVINAGSDDEICQDESYLLSGEGNSYSSVLWTTFGDGFFDDPSILGATYFPGSMDISNNTVDLTLTAFPNYPCIENITDQMTLAIVNFPEQPLAPEGPVTIDLDVTQTSEYTIPQVVNAVNYNWVLYPIEAGNIESYDTIGTAIWETSYLGINAYIYVEAINDCGQTISDSLGVSLNPVNVNSIYDSEIIIYPNPTENYMSITVDQKNIKELNIYNHSNKRVFNTTAYNGVLDISKLSAGIYVIEIITSENIIRQKVIKQ